MQASDSIKVDRALKALQAGLAAFRVGHLRHSEKLADASLRVLGSSLQSVAKGFKKDKRLSEALFELGKIFTDL